MPPLRAPTQKKPKKKNPESLGDLRNISCTLLASKIFETFVLDMLKSEVVLKSNQYGGVKGLSTESIRVQLWQEILENLEDYKAGTVVTSLDYSKAFNRMSYQHCLAALAKKGASTAVIRLVATFLTNRTMTVKVNQTHSQPREVWGGCPQGSILGVFLFNATIDDLEDSCQDLTSSLTGVKEPPPPGLNVSDDSDFSVLDEEEDPPAPLMSTPARRSTLSWTPLTESPIGPRRSGVKKKKKRKPCRLDISAKMRTDLPQEPNHRTEAKWQERRGGQVSRRGSSRQRRAVNGCGTPLSTTSGDALMGSRAGPTGKEPRTDLNTDERKKE